MSLPAIYNETANTVIWVNSSLQIIGYNKAYAEFAKENGLLDVENKFGMGRNVLDCVPSPLIKFYQRLYQRALAGDLVEHEYLCHSPELFRRYLMRLIKREDQTIIVEHSLIVEMPHAQLIDEQWSKIQEQYQLQSNLVIQCCSCRKLRHARNHKRWDLVKALIEHEASRISHSLCPVCAEQIYPGANE